jgi:aspartate kinase
MDRGINTQWLDVRNFIKTNSNYRDAELVGTNATKYLKKCKAQNTKHNARLLGSDYNNFTTTLGREGSVILQLFCLIV